MDCWGWINSSFWSWRAAFAGSVRRHSHRGDPYCVIPEQIAINKLFLHQAVLDSVVVNKTNVINQVENRLNYFISQIGSKEKMEEYFGKSTWNLREDLRTMFQEQMIIQQMQQKLVGDIKVDACWCA